MRGIVAAGLVVAVMALAGCTDDPEPRFEDPTETPSVSDPTSSAAAEKEPWEEKSKAGAVAFAKHWIDVLNEAQLSGNVQRLRGASSDQCVTCRDLAAQLETLYQGGGRVETNGWHILLVGAPQDRVSDEAEVTLRVARAPQLVYEGSGPPERYEGDRATFTADLVWRDDRWLMDALVRYA